MKKLSIQNFDFILAEKLFNKIKDKFSPTARYGLGIISFISSIVLSANLAISLFIAQIYH
ncbi:hypothetical protein [Chryseobacterium limigenitum]|uniref:hypothetical protein n=1 Tax=Chryseobacterium limigenitum TaxID=1612149 RepID=UPI0011147330|nr:hypothetical protein [Chryseobacterium limigenitum]